MSIVIEPAIYNSIVKETVSVDSLELSDMKDLAQAASFDFDKFKTAVTAKAPGLAQSAHIKDGGFWNGFSKKLIFDIAPQARKMKNVNKIFKFVGRKSKTDANEITLQVGMFHQTESAEAKGLDVNALTIKKAAVLAVHHLNAINTLFHGEQATRGGYILCPLAGAVYNKDDIVKTFVGENPTEEQWKMVMRTFNTLNSSTISGGWHLSNFSIDACLVAQLVATRKLKEDDRVKICGKTMRQALAASSQSIDMREVKAYADLVSGATIGGVSIAELDRIIQRAQQEKKMARVPRSEDITSDANAPSAN
ncbi:nucleoprotein [Scaphoideus titanus bunya-like virus 1]|uniref:Nucleoprotein n=1 Tax=Scaphoideus titanus bunya-like virus 1 TaxID=2716551 RepID=A0A6G7NRM4_9VIRU|nr:nucleoprotein [Scaphoideus titanus bunya-like virus 1]QIJ56909.1 nucleoprotein [Scaphoideus titanus bunya-like virus 1]